MAKSIIVAENRYFPDRHKDLRIIRFLLFLISFLMLSSCGEIKDSAPANYSKQWHEIPDAVPVAVKPSK